MSGIDLRQVIKLNVGGRPFEIAKDTLEQIPIFKTKLKDEWSHDVDIGGSYFVDIDPDIFPYILNWARHALPPFFWDKTNGFNYELYDKVQAQADYLGVHELRDYIKEQNYLQRIQWERESPKVETALSVLMSRTVDDANVDVKREVVTMTRKWHVCPRRLAVHRVPATEPRKCGKDCWKHLGETDWEMEEERFVVVVTMKERLIFKSG
jgi:hypothetical protein